MPKSPDGQYELVLENRQVLTIFFAVVILCGVFFGLGYTVGKNTMGYIPPSESNVVAAAGKKSAIQPVNAEGAADRAPGMAYDKLDEKASSPKLEPAAPPPAEARSEPARPAAGETRPAAEPAPAAGEVNINLQVAALSKKEDADALLGLLSKKGFRAYLVSNSADRLYRVQVGPFTSMKDADEVKARLDQEGFRAITRK